MGNASAEQASARRFGAVSRCARLPNGGTRRPVAMPVRNQLLVVQALAKVAADLPFAMLGVDTDNDSAFMNETVFDYCKGLGLEQTRSRAYKKNDQAWVEQKNGAVVRRLVGYGRLSGRAETQALAQLYAVSRLYVNFFQPSFKLKSKRRDGARVHKTYHPPMTPCDRLLSLPTVTEKTKATLRELFTVLDPVGSCRRSASPSRRWPVWPRAGLMSKRRRSRTWPRF